MAKRTRRYRGFTTAEAKRGAKAVNDAMTDEQRRARALAGAKARNANLAKKKAAEGKSPTKRGDKA